MSKPLKAVFMFVSPTADYEKHRVVCDTGAIQVIVVPVKNHSEAEEVAKKLAVEGVAAFELCGGFGHQGTARVVKALEGKVPVGVVRFDVHPCLENKSGDTIFG